MAKKKESAVEESKPVATEASGSPKSKVDVLFDSLTVQAARGLVVAQTALVVVARWLDGQAKTVGDLATKLSAEAGEASSTIQAPEQPAAS